MNESNFDYAKANIELKKLFHRLHKIKSLTILEKGHFIGQNHCITSENDMGCSETEFQALHVISSYMQKYPEEKGIYVSDLAVELCIAPSAASRMLRGLEKKSLIERSVDLRDRRNTNVYLTDRGKKQFKEYERSMEVYMKKVFERMDKDEMLQLMGLVQKLTDLMEEELQAGKEFYRRKGQARGFQGAGRNGDE